MNTQKASKLDKEVEVPDELAQDWKKELAYIPPLVEWAKGLQSNAELVPDNAEITAAKRAG